MIVAVTVAASGGEFFGRAWRLEWLLAMDAFDDMTLSMRWQWQWFAVSSLTVHSEVEVGEPTQNR